ncbi:RsmB/NOP family class I SAM-dependent RNA methyltransferase [Nitratireductor basaltis]|uniref:Fmu (Sun) n=1 Tax=Nitratireductor basaltis TaxID=472175 RepID=A0A084U6N2_9HYPH|nr:RsmB/NOP family class I SAM-dependent RNA methyltransferase [Nitratireductor basaltis]KFB08618.1 Fmu (Sun) [Nitratireductor basaltis]
MNKAQGARSARRKPEIIDDKPGLDARRVATRLLGAVVDARSSLDAVTDSEHGHPQYVALDPRDRALVRAMLVTALRRRCGIEKAIMQRLDRPLPGNARSLSHILHIGAVQILFLDVPDSAAVDLAVSQAKSDPRNSRFSALVNGVLRNIARRKDAILQKIDEVVDAPEWFQTRLSEAYGAERAARILAAHRLEAPVDFTVKSDPKRWAEAFGGTVLANGSVRVDKLDTSVPELEGFDEGEWWVQDAAASLPAKLIGARPGMRVLDLCAAPGGKTAQLAHYGAKVTAVDLSASRLKRLAANLQRLKLDAEISKADGLTLTVEEPFDAVLLDAPCSSNGTVRRHPDVPWTKTPEDIEKLAELQRKLLEHAATLVRAGGTLVFANCSIDPLEGEAVVSQVLASDLGLELSTITASELTGAAHFITPEGYLRTLPDAAEAEEGKLQAVDGFFAARFVKR